MAEKGLWDRRLEFTISWATIFKIFAAVLIAYLAIQLRLLFGLLLIAFLIAVTLWPIVRWTSQRKWPRWAGILIAVHVLLACVALFLGLLIPSITNQVTG
jgi:predicted PurR-regulated permease PerM